MARTGRDGPTDRAWPAAVVLGLTLVAGASALALVWPMVFGPCPCRDPDGRPALVVATSRGLWVAVAAARYVASGALGFVYESTPALTALPLYPILLAPLVAAGDALGLSGPPAPAATLDLLLAPFTVGLAVPLLHQVGCSGTPATGPRPWPPRPGRRCWPWSRPWCCTGTGRMPGPARPGRRRPAGRAGALGGDRARPGGGGGVQAVGPAGPPGPGRLDPAAGAAPAGRGRPRPPGRPGPVRARGGLAPCLAGPAPPAQLPGVRARRAVGGRRAGHGGPGGQVQVGGALLEHLLEQLGHPDRALGSSVPQPHPGRGGPPSSPSVCMPRSCALGWLLRFLPIRSERLAGGLNSGLVRCRGASRAGSPPGPG
jgi:hypothetical protein